MNLLQRWYRNLRQIERIERLQDLIQIYKANKEADDELRRKAPTYNFPLGSKILVIPNSPADFIVGEVVGYEPMTKSRQLFVLYRNLATGELELTHNASYWNQDLEDLIRELPWWKRWNVVHPSLPYSEAKALHLEKYGTLCNFEEEEHEQA
jgi:hypothetical protein